MCKKCQLFNGKVKGGSLCKVLEGVQTKDQVCPPSVVEIYLKV